MTDEGKTLAKLDVRPGDVVRCVDNTLARSSLIAGKEYVIGDSGCPVDEYGDEFRWSFARFTIVSRATPSDPLDGWRDSEVGREVTPADPVKLDERENAAIREQRRFEAALAAMTCVTAMGAPGILNASKQLGITEAAAIARAAVEIADALLAALEASHD